VLLPGFVNAHTHLDLTHLGPRPHQPDDGFVAWVEMIRAGRHAADAAIADSVRRGIELSLAAGTVAIGDIAGAPRGRPSLVPWRTMRSAGIRGVSYLEFFGIGKTAERSRAALIEALAQTSLETAVSETGTRLGLQPHAPNTVSRRLYMDALQLAATAGGSVPGAKPLPVCTHLAETPEEREFVAYARGPQRDLLERLGLWDESILEELGRGQHPVQHLREVLAHTPMLVAHVNDADDAAIESLAATRTSVVYCPHASAYFAAERHFGPHRYRDMLAAGINVALGTDSIVNLPAGSDLAPTVEVPTTRASGMSVLREIRILHQRDRCDPLVLLQMATTAGARALGMDERAFGFHAGVALAGLIAVETERGSTESGNQSVAQAFDSAANPELLFADKTSGVTGTLGDRLT
jgi:cytosine/adenosine deaminase-related metal-dependent hydrolase